MNAETQTLHGQVFITGDKNALKMENNDSNDPETPRVRRRESETESVSEWERKKVREKTGSEGWAAWKTDVATNVRFQERKSRCIAVRGEGRGKEREEAGLRYGI